MKKLAALLLTVLAFLESNEIFTLFLIAIIAGVIASFLLASWAKTEKDTKLNGSFDADWGKKK